MKEVKANHIEYIASLVKKAKKGDKKAFHLLYKNTWKPVYYMLYKKTGNKADAEILLNEVYIKVFVGIGGFKNEITFFSWITRISHNVYIDFLRSNGRLEAESASINDEFIDSETELDEEFIPELALEKKEHRTLVMKTIDELPEKQREAIYMFYYLNMKSKEIAEATNTTENTVTKRLHDARKSLKIKLGELLEKGVIIYNMTGYFVLREIFIEDMFLCVDEGIGAAAWASVSNNAAVTLAQRSLATKAIRTFAIQLTAGAAIAGVATTAIIQTMNTRDISHLSVITSEKQIGEQESFIKQNSLGKEAEPSTEIKNSEIPLSTPKLPEEESLYPKSTIETATPPGETSSPIEVMEETQTSEVTSDIQEEITIESAKPTTIISEERVFYTEEPVSQSATPQSATPQNREIQIDILYEIGEGPDENGLINDIILFSGGAASSGSGEITILSYNFDKMKAGEYYIHLIYRDDRNISNIKATVKVTDTIAPTIKVGNMKIRLEKGIIFSREEILVLADVSIIDNSGEEITPTITGYEKIDFIYPEDDGYVLIINASDSAGNAAVQNHIFITVE